MRIAKTDFKILAFNQNDIRRIETAARICYKSEAKMTSTTESADRLIRMLIRNGHEAMLEHSSLSVIFTVDRALSHELVRHRMASFAQESQRYCNYSKDQFDGHVTFIQPYWMREGTTDFDIWKKACLDAEQAYFELLDYGLKPEEARIVLPNSTKTEIVVTANYREWRHILQLRCDKHAHPDMRELMRRLLKTLKEIAPVVFEDIPEEDD